MTDPGVLPSRSVSIMAFDFCRDDTTRESYLTIVSALFDCFNTENLRVVQLLTNMNSLPMGKTSINYSWKLNISSGARPVLPMGVAPEAIVESFLSIGSNKLFLCMLCIVALRNDFIGCATSAPSGSSPRGYSRKFFWV
jgi:hypothetical protein